MTHALNLTCALLESAHRFTCSSPLGARAYPALLQTRRLAPGLRSSQVSFASDMVFVDHAAAAFCRKSGSG